MRVVVVTLGKIGLPLAVQFTNKGHEVIGVDVSKRRVELVNEAKEPFPGGARLRELLSEAVTSGRLRAITDYREAIPDTEAVILVVPFVVDENSIPDLRWMDAAASSPAEHLSANTVVSYKTTLSVDMTREHWKPMIEEISGLKEGRDFHLVFSPERVLSGRVFADLRRYSKLVGGLNESGAAAGTALYEQLLDFDERADLPRGNGVWDIDSAEVAELAKLAETTYHDVNIALVNQFTILMGRAGIDTYTVIEACNSQPYNHLHRPGVTVGGHCIPVYPRLYLSSDPDADVVSTARAANAVTPEYVVSKLAELLGDLRGSRIAAFGAVYRGGVRETALSGVFATVDALRHRGILVLVNDPLYMDEKLKDFDWMPYHFDDEVDAAIIQADHEKYAGLEPADLPGVRTLFDGRAISDPVAWRGVPRLLVGKGCWNVASGGSANGKRARWVWCFHEGRPSVRHMRAERFSQP